MLPEIEEKLAKIQKTGKGGGEAKLNCPLCHVITGSFMELTTKVENPIALAPFPQLDEIG